MKKIYTFIAVSVAALSFAQFTSSFEQSEGFVLGDVNGQNGWEVTEGADGIFKNQVITNENSNGGTQQSLKIDVDMEQNFGWFPIYGASKTLETAVDYKKANIEFDINVTGLEGSTFEFGTWGISNEDYVPTMYFAFNSTGILEVVKSVDYDYHNTGFTWTPNTWYKLKAEISEENIKYYVNGELIYTDVNYSKTDIIGFNFVHDNFAEAAYIDNVKINNRDLATWEVEAKKSMTVFPNPAKNTFSINTNEKVSNYTIFNITGQKVLSGTNDKDINIESLKAGVYIIRATTVDNKVLTSKLIKK